MNKFKKTVRRIGWIFLIALASIGIGLGAATTVPIVARKEDMFPEIKVEMVEEETDNELEEADIYKS